MQSFARHAAVKAVIGLVVMVVGTGASAGLLILFHSGLLTKGDEEAEAAVSFDTPPPQRKQPPKEKKPAEPKPRPKAAKAPPPPSLGSSLAGMSFGLPQFEGDLLGGASDALLGDRSDAVMSEDAVDDPPRPVTRAACAYPSRARQRNAEGFVTLSLLVQADGSLSDVRVLEADPPGMFEEVALACIQAWRFDPALYQGKPVAVRARQTLRFVLE
jgi:protein TonB